MELIEYKIEYVTKQTDWTYYQQNKKQQHVN